MRSAEAARLAGVTVRTLRHYHQIGLLDEPPRSTNGYREYGVLHLVRVLRIQRLAALGIPLDRVADMLTDDEDSDSALDDLDAELAAQIAVLEARRVVIAQLRTASAPGDAPPELARFLAVFAARDSSGRLSRLDHDLTVLLAHLVGEEGMPHLERVYAAISETAPAESAAFLDRFDALDENTTEEELQEVIRLFATHSATTIAAVEAAGPAFDLSLSSPLLAQYTASQLNPTQLRVLHELSGALAEDASKRAE